MARCPRSGPRGLLLSAVMLTAACERWPVVVVTVQEVPAGAATLEVSVKLGGEGAADIAPIPLPGAAAPAQSFGVRLPPERRGLLVVGVGALDGGGCLSAVGFGEGDFTGAASALELTLAPVPGGRAVCGGGAPVLLEVTPALVPTTGGTQVSIRGWGFERDATVSISSLLPANLLWRTRSEILADAPPFVGAVERLPLPAPLIVQSASGKRDRRDDLLAYYAAIISFAPQRTALSCRGPQALAIGDLDGDGEGRRDLAVACRDDGAVQLLLNLGAGTFGPGPTLDSGPRPSALSLVPVPGAGRPALVTASAADNSVSVRLPDGLLGFLPPVSYVVGLQPVALRAADLDRDGQVDVLAAHQVSRDVQVLRAQGQGRFGAFGRSLSAGRAPSDLAAVDLDGDGLIDLAVANRDDGTVTLLRGAGDGSFSAPRSLPVGRAPAALAALDLDGEGPAELLVGDAQDATLRVVRVERLGRGAPTGDAGAGVTTSYLAGGPVTALLSADLDGDGRADVAAATSGEGAGEQRVRLLRSDGRGGLTAAGSYPVDPRPAALAAGDLDGDGRTDLVVASREAGTVTILWNRSH